MSKFYVGGTFSRYEEVRSIIDILIGMGHTCTHDWTRGEWFTTDTSAGDGYTAMEHWPQMAQAEVEAVREVSQDPDGFCVFLGQEASLGWSTEFGMSIAFDVARIYLIEPFKNTVFVSLPQVLETDLSTALDMISDRSTRARRDAEAVHQEHAS